MPDEIAVDENYEDLLYELGGICVRKYEMSDFALTKNGQAFRVCYLSQCDGEPFVPLSQYLSMRNLAERIWAQREAEREEWLDYKRGAEAKLKKMFTEQTSNISAPADVENAPES